MTYDERKVQLLQATIDFLRENGGLEYDYDDNGTSPGPIVNVNYFGELRDERILELFLDDGDLVTLHTLAYDGEEWTDFVEFSNQEMEMILDTLDIPYPKLKKYLVTISSIAYLDYEVEAENEDQATKDALEKYRADQLQGKPSAVSTSLPMADDALVEVYEPEEV